MVRQAGRERAANVIDAEPRHEAILAAVERASRPAFRESLAGMANPYGDGRAAERIVHVLAQTRLGEVLLHKRPVDRTGESSS